MRREPENRLVARSLEARWEARLTALADAEQALQAARDALPPLPGRDELEKLAADLPGLWNAPDTSGRDRKRLLRTLIADVTVLPEPDQAKVRIGIRWHTGATDVLIADRPLPPGPAKRSPSPAVEMVRRLGPTTDTRDLAERLNAAGLATGHGNPFDVAAVQWIRHAYKIPAPAPTHPANSALPRPPASWAAAPASSTTGSRPGNSTPAAAPATGCASPGPTTSRPAAVPAWPDPGTSTPKPGAPSPGNDAKATEMSVQSAMLTSTDPRMRA